MYHFPIYVAELGKLCCSFNTDGFENVTGYKSYVPRSNCRFYVDHACVRQLATLTGSDSMKKRDKKKKCFQVYIKTRSSKATGTQPIVVLTDLTQKNREGQKTLEEMLYIININYN